MKAHVQAVIDLFDSYWRKPGRKSHHATSDRAPVEVTFCMDDGCRYAAGHEGPHDITWQAEHSDGQVCEHGGVSVGPYRCVQCAHSDGTMGAGWIPASTPDASDQSQGKSRSSFPTTAPSGSDSVPNTSPPSATPERDTASSGTAQVDGSESA